MLTSDYTAPISVHVYVYNSIKILYQALRSEFLFSASLSLSRFSYCTSSSSAGALHGLVSRGTASCVRPPAFQSPPLVLLHPPRCAAVLAPPYQTPAPAAPLQILVPPQRFVLLTQLHISFGQVLLTVSTRNLYI